MALVADARLALQDLAAALADGGIARAKRQPWCAEVPARMAKWREGAVDRLRSDEKPINVGRLMGELNGLMPEDAILVADGGFAGHWGGLLFDTKRAGRHFIADRGFASIGYGLPGSMGAQLAAPKRRVVGLTGDGGFNMTLGELETARRAGTPFVLCVFNNAASGYVKALQHSMFGQGNYQSSDLVEMDYAAITRAMGCRGIRVEDPSQLAPALREGLENTATPTVLDIVVVRAIRQKCCPASTTARWSSTRATGRCERRYLPRPLASARAIGVRHQHPVDPRLLLVREGAIELGERRPQRGDRVTQRGRSLLYGAQTTGGRQRLGGRAGGADDLGRLLRRGAQRVQFARLRLGSAPPLARSVRSADARHPSPRRRASAGRVSLVAHACARRAWPGRVR